MTGSASVMSEAPSADRAQASASMASHEVFTHEPDGVDQAELSMGVARRGS